MTPQSKTKAAHGARKAQILDMLAENPNLTTREVAEAAGCSTATVRALCNRAMVTPKRAIGGVNRTVAYHEERARVHLRKAEELRQRMELHNQVKETGNDD